MRPAVNITVSNGGLNRTAPGEFGTTAILVASPIAPLAGYGVPFLVRNIAQAVAQLNQVGNELVIAAIVDGYFAEAGEGGKLYIMCMAPTTTMQVMLAAANIDKLILAGNGAIRVVAVVKFPGIAYTPTVVTGFDEDVILATALAQTRANAWLALSKPFRVLLEGFGFTTSTAAADFASGNKPNVGIVVGKVADSTATLTLLALGRAAQASPQQNIGRVKSGSLKIAEAAVVKIGATTVEQTTVAILEELHTKRYITVERNEAAPGYVFSDDNMLVTVADDYNSLRNGRVIDNGIRVAKTTYYNELKNDVDVDEDGRISKAIEKALETGIETAIDQQMPGQLSSKADGTADVQCLVNPNYEENAAIYNAAGVNTAPNFNLLETDTIYLFLRMRPKGCLKYINVFIGFTS